ncbi:MAG: metallopeptidase TldD-related protein, partial [Actinomycetota bacterium]|nr:metallopeptidase TldD-related protein [Actinomycetota bacterium]
VESTGHALPAPNPWGPLPRHLVMAPGHWSVDDLVAGVERGLMVTRLWYTRTLNAKQTLVTGMTRDGTFRIDGGRRGPAVRNLRYNQSVLEALAGCDGVGDRLRVAVDGTSQTRAPALRLRSFRFTSVSDH